MDRLSILLLVLLGISRIQARYCGGSMAKKCVQRNRCRIGTETGKPIIDFRGLSNGNQGCESGHTCCPITEILQHSVQTGNQQIPLDCGHANPQGVSFTITNAGDFAQDGELPWMVAVIDARNSQPIGGGSLIKPDVVLTSSSKTSEIPENYLIVRAGEWDFQSTTELRPHVDVPIRKIVRHPGLSMTSGASNAALLFLARPLNLDHHINLICLPPPNRNYINSLCTVSGWGRKTIADNSYMNVLKKIEVPLVEKSECQPQLQNVAGKEFFLDNSLICAGGEPGKDSCKGDGGAPLVCPLQSDPNRYEQVGIVNFGFGCGEPIPAIYTDVSQIRSWIDYSIQANAVNYSPELGNVSPSPAQVGESIPNKGYGLGGLAYDPPNQGGGFISYLGDGYEANGPLPIGGHIQNERQGYSGNGYDPNPGVGYPLFGASGAGNPNPNVRQENYAPNHVGVGINNNNLAGRTIIGGGAIENPNQINVINPKFGDSLFGAGNQNPNIRVGANNNDLGGRTVIGGGAIENPNNVNVINPGFGDFSFGELGAGNPNPNMRQENYAPNQVGGGAIENPNQINVINPKFGDSLFGAGNQNPNIRVGANNNDLGGRAVIGGGAIENPNNVNVINPEFGDPAFGVLGAGNQNPNTRAGGKNNDLGGRRGTRGGAIENPNKINVIRLGDFPTTTTTPSPPVTMEIVKA
ncbi:uncharacterized protein LOC122615108 [Drosophila teissieri]|uniref:uncharacterized protein LOC122615108 n=1 Tax=Drosophila teissieri TaxID=7243 RepID=UPI001CB9D9BA|nr:uncharacterized protein LOC122615108 [Drosophila teissieri]